VEISKILSEKHLVLKELDCKADEIAMVNLKNLNLAGELSEICEELEETKLAFDKKYLESKVKSSKIDKLGNIIKNLKNQKNQIMEIAESKFSELQNQMKAKGLHIEKMSIEKENYA
jgi:hypothetical protein